MQRLGLVKYQRAWEHQNNLASKVATGERENTLLLLEHPHTYTLGRRAKAENLIWSEAELVKNNTDVLWVDRGGDITYHGPGQLVGYPILRLSPIGWQADRLPQADYLGYIHDLEDVLICTLAEFQITGHRIKDKTGVWVFFGPDQIPMKIASIGIKVDAGGITRHGFALNVDPDMRFWQGIVPCGLSQVEMVSMAQLLGKGVELEEVISAVTCCFGEVFDMKIVCDEVSISP